MQLLYKFKLELGEIPGIFTVCEFDIILLKLEFKVEQNGLSFK
jgi:hypothetical protein